jgi:hypothetical protein
VAAQGLVPPYQGAHFAYDPHDHQHLIRYTRVLKVLAWLANDSLAKDDLRLQAENFHLSFHEYGNSPGGGYPGAGLLSKERFVAQYPHNGFGYGRGEAWGLDCAVATYACADDAWRARKLPWIQRQTELLLAGQASCSGFVQAIVSDKALDGRYRARQLMEQSITENALVGLHESVYGSAHPGYAAMVRDVLADSLRAFIGELSWWPGESGPWRYTGVGPLDPGTPTWCARSQMPPDSVTVGDLNTFQDWSSFAYGHVLTGDPEFLRKARIQMGASSFDDLARRLEADGLLNLENRAALLTVVQRIQGRL